jgi:hypothetical protein
MKPSMMPLFIIIRAVFLKSNCAALLKRSLLCCLALCALSPKGALAQSVDLVGNKWVLISTTKNPNGPCGASKNVFFDGVISPFSYVGTSGQTVVQIPASLGATNYRYLGSLVDGDLAPNYSVDCQGMYTALKSADPTIFRWSEWLYGFYRSPVTGYVYSTIYNEYYGGNFPPAPCCPTAAGRIILSSAITQV